MPNLSIRKLDEKLYHLLQARAAAKHVSMEEEARQILQQVVLAPNNIPEIFEKYFGATLGVELDIPKDYKKPHPPMEFEE